LTWRRFLGRFLRYTLLAAVIILPAGELLVRRLVPDELVYLPPVRHWDLAKHTDLFGELRKNDMVTVGDRPVTKSKPDWMTRAVCLGGAVTAGIGLANRGEAYPTLLHQARDRFDILDAGCAGYNAYRLQVYLADVLLHLAPGVVVLHYGRATESEASDRRFHQQAARIAERLRAGGRDTPEEQLFAVHHGTANRLPLALGRLLNRSKAFLYFHNRAVARRRSLEKSPADCDSREALEAIADLLAENRVRLILVPETTATGEPICAPNAAWMAEQCQAGRAVCLEPFGDVAPADLSKYYADRTHLNHAGHERLASELSTMLVELLPSASPGKPPAKSSE